MVFGLSQKSQHRADDIARIRADLAKRLSEAKDKLKLVKGENAALPFGSSNETIEVSNRRVREAEDMLKALERQINEGGKQLAQARAEEALEELPKLTLELVAGYRRLHEHNSAVAKLCRELEALNARQRQLVRARRSAGNSDLWRRPLAQAVKNYMNSIGLSNLSVDQRALHAAAQELLQTGRFPIGADYDTSPAAAILQSAAGFTLADLTGASKADDSAAA